MHKEKDNEIKIEKMKEMYYLIGEILEKINILSVDDMEIVWLKTKS